MTLRAFRAFGLFVSLALALTACDSGQENPPDTRVRVVNVAPSFSTLYYSREHVTRFNGTLSVPFNGMAEPSTTYDEGTYDFYAYQQNPLTNTVSQDPFYGFEKQLLAGTFYTFVLLEAGGNLEHAILESPPVLQSASDSQVQLLHGAENVPAVDIYLEPPGTTITGAAPWGSVSFRGVLPPRNVPAGDYELTVTPAGNPAVPLLTSVSFALSAAQSMTFVISPDNGSGTGQLAVAAITPGQSGVLVNRGSPASVRVLNATNDKAPRDVAFYGQFSPPQFAATAFATPTARSAVTAGTEIPIAVTPAGNPGVLELDQIVALGAGFPYTVMIHGDAGALAQVSALDDLRRITGIAKIRFLNAAPQFFATELVLVPPGGDPARVFAVSQLVPGVVGTPVEVIPETYDLYLRDFATTTIVAGPISVTLASRGIYSVLATNGDSSASANVTLFDDFQ